MPRLFIVVCLLALAGIPRAHAQTAALSGIVKDASTLEPIVSANVFLVGTAQGVVSSTQGTFVIRMIPPGSYLLRTSFIGFADNDIPVNFAPDESLFVEILLLPDHVEEEEVVVTATRTVRHIADVPVRIE